MKKWEYQILHVDIQTMMKKNSADTVLNELGSEGWEVVGMAQGSVVTGLGTINKFAVILKREKK